jgi:DNA polymerase I
MTTRRDIIAWDTETHLIKPGMPAPRMVCLSESDGQRTRLYTRPHMVARCWELLQQRSVGHHVVYDLGVACAEDSRLLPLVFDALEHRRLFCTKLTQKMLDNARGELKYVFDEETLEYRKQRYGLSDLVKRYSDVDISESKKAPDAWRLRYHELDGIPLNQWPREADAYARNDAKHTHDVDQAQHRLVADDEIPGYAGEMKAAWALHMLGIWGVRTDPQAVSAYRKELTTQLAAQISVCQEHGFRARGERPSRRISQIREAIDAWCRANNKEPLLTEKRQQIATSREALMRTDHPGLRAVAESVRLEKLLTTYVAALERGTEVPLNPQYNTPLETYRTSCSGGAKIDGAPVGMNMQNLPRGGRVRECVIPRPGWVFAFCDYDTIEMIGLAQICLWLFGYSALAEAARAGMDFHILLAADICAMPYKQVLDLYKDNDVYVSGVRQYSKIGNYGFSGGMAEPAFIDYAKGYGLDISFSLATTIRDTFRKRWPEMNDYFRFNKRVCRNGPATIIFEGTGMIRGKVGYTAACNGWFQHLVAIGAKAALYQVVKESWIDSGSPLYGCRPFLFAHDEIGIEIPFHDIGIEASHNAAMRLQAVMNDEMQKWMPDVPVRSSVAMTRRWYKGAKAMYHKGLLVPVRPSGREWITDV